jgi:hypothetical protein
LDITSPDQLKGVEASIAGLLAPHLRDTDASAILKAAQEALAELTPNSIVLYWQQEHVLTRLRFWDVGCEILFVWHGESASYRVIDSIVRLLAGVHSRVAEEGSVYETSPLAWISGQRAGTIIRPSELAQALSLEPARAREELISAMQVGLVLPVYRLAVNSILAQLENHWNTSPHALMRLFEDENGNLIDGEDPRNIEVAFRRAGISEVQP